jgi:hypothetical protein
MRLPDFHRHARALAPLLAAAALVACGGGGASTDGSTSTGADGAATNASPSTALADFRATTGVPQNFRAAATLPAELVSAAAAQLPPSTRATYLKVWVADPATGSPNVLSFGRWSAQQSLPTVQPQLAVDTVRFEVYNDAGSVSGEWRLP